MKKNIQIRVILVLFILGLTLLIGNGIFYIKFLQQVGSNNLNDLSLDIDLQIQKTKILVCITSILFTLIVLTLTYFLVQVVYKPLEKISNEIKKMEKGKEIDLKKIANEIDNSKINNLIGTFDDITQSLKSNVEELKNKNKQVSIILEKINDGIIVFDRVGKISNINTSAFKLLDIHSNKETFEQIFEKLNVDTNIEKIIYLDRWTSFTQTLEFGGKDLNILFQMFTDENLNPKGVMVIIKDITQAVELNNSRKEFVADVSHELKTPLTSIMGYAETLSLDETNPMKKKFLDIITEEAQRMSMLVSDLLELSLYDNKKKEIHKELFDIVDLIKDCENKIRVQAERKRQHIALFNENKVSKVYADKDAIRRVIINIISNSIKYTSEDGDINIYTGTFSNYVYVKITDNGIGIPEEDLKKIFERFYRVDKARSRKAGGTGLGLSIAKEILDQNGGSIDITSKKGEGTEVIIKIPTKN